MVTPVISLITEPDNLFDNEKGIFVLGQTYTDWLAEDPANADEPSYRVHGNFSNKGRDWERPVSFEYMPSNGKNVSADMGLRMKGASTRTYLQRACVSLQGLNTAPNLLKPTSFLTI